MNFLSGHIKTFEIFIAKDVVTVTNETGIVTRQQVMGLSTFIRKAADLALGWARFADFDVVYLYDKADENFGYGLNLADPTLSEWGFAPFPAPDTTPEKMKKGGET